MTEPPVDEFEYNAQLWSAQSRIVEAAEELAALHNLDPMLVDRLKDAVAENSTPITEDPRVVQFLKALADAQGLKDVEDSSR